MPASSQHKRIPELYSSAKSTSYSTSKNRKRLHLELTRTKVLSNARESFEFGFARVFDKETAQDEVYDVVAKPVIDNCLDGYNGTIFAYGQTGSGKTFTMNGGGTAWSSVDSWQFRGIIPRVLTVFQNLTAGSAG